MDTGANEIELTTKQETKKLDKPYKKNDEEVEEELPEEVKRLFNLCQYEK